MFSGNMTDCNGLTGSIDPISEDEVRYEMLSSWLWSCGF